jgi:hypothetical protein
VDIFSNGISTRAKFTSRVVFLEYLLKVFGYPGHRASRHVGQSTLCLKGSSPVSTSVLQDESLRKCTVIVPVAPSGSRCAVSPIGEPSVTVMLEK